ncbi:MAG: hypothetical protein AAFQ36_11565 [Pseudomonadota bacterium]
MLAHPLAAQEDPSLTAEELFELLDALEAQLDPPKLTAITGVASAHTAPHGVGFVGVAGTNNRERAQEDKIDGSLAFGLGLGNSEIVGAQIVVDVTSVKLNGFGDSGIVGVKLNRSFSAFGQPITAALSVDQLLPWGDSKVLNPSVTPVMTTRFEGPELLGTRWPLLFTTGYEYQAKTTYRDSNAFAGVGLGLTQNLGTSVAHNGEEWTIGAIASIPWVSGLGFGVAVSDVANDNSDRRAIVTVSYARTLFGGSR